MCVFCMKSLPCSRPCPQWVVDFKCIDIIQWSTFGDFHIVLRSKSVMLTSIRMKIWRKREERRCFTTVCKRLTCDFHSWSYNPATIRWSTFSAYRYIGVFGTIVANVIITGNATHYLNTVQGGACVTTLSQQQPCSGCICVLWQISCISVHACLQGYICH